MVRHRWVGPLNAYEWVIFGNNEQSSGKFYEFCTSDADVIIWQWALARSIRRLIVITRKSQWCALYCHGTMHKTCFFIKLNPLAPKDDNNHCGSVMLRKWNNQYSCQPLTCKGMDGLFKFWYFAFSSGEERIIIFHSFYLLILVFWSAMR